MTPVIAAIGLAATLVAPPAAPAPAAPQAAALQPSPVVEVLTLNGSGCPVGSTSLGEVGPAGSNRIQIDLEQDGADTYVAAVGPRADATDLRKNCQLTLGLNLPSGYTYAVERIRMRGDASLRTGATARVGAIAYFQGESAQAEASEELDGPLRGSWRTWLAFDDPQYAPCDADRYLNLNTDLRVDQGRSSSSANSSVTADLSFTLEVDVRRC